jgi:hypothetical protein
MLCESRTLLSFLSFPFLLPSFCQHILPLLSILPIIILSMPSFSLALSIQKKLPNKSDLLLSITPTRMSDNTPNDPPEVEGSALDTARFRTIMENVVNQHTRTYSKCLAKVFRWENDTGAERMLKISRASSIHWGLREANNS